MVVWSFCPLPKEEVGWEQCLLGSIYLGLYTSQKVAYLSLSLKYFKVLAYCSVVGLVEGGARKLLNCKCQFPRPELNAVKHGLPPSSCSETRSYKWPVVGLFGVLENWGEVE